MINSQAVLYSSGNNDECYTPAYVVEAILPYLPKDKTYWLPFVRDDRGCVYKYSNRRVAEMKAEMIVRKMWRVGYKIVLI